MADRNRKGKPLWVGNMAVKQKTNDVRQREHQNIYQESLTIALGIILDRIRSLPANDREDLYQLMMELPKVACEEELNSVFITMREILDQVPVRAQPLDQAEGQPVSPGLQKWMDFAAERIKAMRKEAGLTQEQLAEKSGLPQSHISRIESGKHSPTRLTLEKIAKALNVDIDRLDPSA